MSRRSRSPRTQHYECYRGVKWVRQLLSWRPRSGSPQCSSRLCVPAHHWSCWCAFLLFATITFTVSAPWGWRASGLKVLKVERPSLCDTVLHVCCHDDSMSDLNTYHRCLIYTIIFAPSHHLACAMSFLRLCRRSGLGARNLFARFLWVASLLTHVTTCVRICMSVLLLKCTGVFMCHACRVVCSSARESSPLPVCESSRFSFSQRHEAPNGVSAIAHPCVDAIACCAMYRV